MQRKIAKQKKKPVKRAKRGFFFYAMRIFFVSVVIIVSFTATNFVLHIANTPPTCANSKSCSTDLSEKIENNAVGFFEGKKVIPPKIDLSHSAVSPVLGAEAPSGDKHIYVDLSSQTLYAYQGKTLFFKTLVATGKWGRTPTGNFNIWEKLVSTRMTGGEGADAYDLPNVPYVMYFYHDFGLHGAYWHDNFGHPMSHGCVNMRQVDAKTLYDWTDGPSNNQLGTAVSVCDSVTSNMQCIQNNPIN